MKIKKFLKQLGIKKLRPKQKESVNSLLQNNIQLLNLNKLKKFL